MPDVKLAGRLPGSTDKNGALAIQKALLDEPLVQRIGLIMFDAPTEAINHEENEQTPKLRVLWIEPVTDAAEASALLEQMNLLAESRTGKRPLFDDEPELVE